MKRILFTIIPEKGHLNPCIGVAQHLQNLGYELGFYAARDISAQLKAAGLDGFLGEFTAGPPPDWNRGAKLAATVRQPEVLRQWIKSLLIDNVSAQVDALRSVVRNFQPDLIVADPMVYQAAIVASENNLPWVALSNSLNPVLNDKIDSELLRTVAWMNPARQELFARYGLSFNSRGCDLLSPFLTIAFTSEAFTGPVPGVELVGPSFPVGSRGDERPFDWTKLATDVPIIYLSLGSQIYYQPTIFDVVFKAVAGKPVQLVAVVNELIHTDLLRDIPDNVLPVHYAPQLQLLPKTAAMITHGGANSIMEAIRFGIPLLINPICNDQFHQVHFIEKTGIGKAINLEKSTPEACWEALQKLINPGSMRDNMQRVSDSYQTDGAARAATLIAKLADKP